MLRRRIFASAMASVMAITSVAAVASADETVAKSVKTKAELDEYVKSFDSFVKNEIYDYGTVSGQNFQDAIDFARNVLADSASTVDDYTVAYKMVESVHASLVIYSADDLKRLIDSCKKIYDTNNIMNIDLGDLIYNDDAANGFTFTEFAAAYDNAKVYLNSNDSQLITDAFETLEAAKKNLIALDVVTKAQFRSAIKSYEQLISKKAAYDSWRRGSFTSDWVNLTNGNYWTISGRAYTFGELMDILKVRGVNGDVKQWGEWPEGSKMGDPADTDTWKYGYYAVEVLSGATLDVKAWRTGPEDNDYETSIEVPSWGSTLEQYINAQYEKFDAIKTSTKTSDPAIVKAYKSAASALDIYNAWSADDTTRAAKSDVTRLLEQYHAQLVAKYQTTTAEKLYTKVTGKTAKANWNKADNKYYGASLKNDSANLQQINIDADKFWAPDGGEGTTVQKVPKNADLLKYVQVKSDDLPDGKLKDALALAEAYNAGNYSAIFDADIDETGAVSKATGSIAEWTLVYRYLKYALEDEFNGSAKAKYTKADVVALINQAYDLAEATGDASIFAAEHMDLVDARQAALAWVAAANKDKAYKDGAASTAAYEALKKPYDALSNKLADYKYSFGEIYNKIAEVSEQIDSEELKATDDLVGALNTTARLLSTISVSEADNTPFTADRVFSAYNRLLTNADRANDFEKELLAAYEALDAAVKAQTEKKDILGDVNGDGAVTAADAAEILKAVVGMRDAIANEIGDVNGDGAVTAADASQILAQIVGL